MSNFWRDRNVVVTGAGGFIGSHLCEKLVKLGAKVTAITHYDIRPTQSNLEYIDSETYQSLNIIPGDVTDPWFMTRALENQDTVFHLAALIAIPYSYRAPASYVRTNVEGTLNALEAFRCAQGRKFVHTSTSEVYGSAQFTPIDETHPLQGQSPYSASKIAADKLVESFYLSFETPVVTLRPFNTYGPRQSARAVIPTIISQCLSDQTTRISLGDLSTVRDFNFVHDTVNAFVEVAENGQCIGDTFNAGSGNSVTIGRIAELVQSLVGCSKEVISNSDRLRPKKSEVRELIAESAKLKSTSNWAPAFSLEDGLLDTINFVRDNIHSFKPGEYSV